MIHTPPELDLITKIQVDLKCIRDLHPDRWDGDRVLNLGRNLAIRSLASTSGIPEVDATTQVEEAILRARDRVKPGEWDVATAANWAMICASLNLLSLHALSDLSTRICDWRKELQRSQHKEALLEPNASLSDAILVANTIAAYGEVDEMELLEALSPEQKKQLWGALSRPVRVELAKLGAIRKARQREAA